MIDDRGCFPQAFAGGSSGKPCTRKRLIKLNTEFPTVAPDYIAKRTELDVPHREMEPFAGTVNLPWMMARARSTGSLERSGKIFFNGQEVDDYQMKKGSALAKVVMLRTETEFDALVKVLVSALSEERKPDLRWFRQPYNEHRHLTQRTNNEQQRRKIVLRVLQKYPICSITHLAQVSDREWTQIGRELGGIPHGVAMKAALEYVQTNMSPIDRAVFWAAVGTRQRIVDHGRSCMFAGTVPAGDKTTYAARAKKGDGLSRSMIF